ncbi:MAG: antitoxin of toxin-antitoxin stability system [Synergistaceae bacterium]|jgi:hypothetical protein|nr:antitoxin of toxin-antitoxin stability system [Synergistaceae bacterium]
MSKEAVFTMKLEPKLRKDFFDAVDAIHRPASQVVRELRREFIQQQGEAKEYKEFLHHKVIVARMQTRTEQSRSDGEVECEFAKRRRGILQVTGDCGG